MGDGQCIEYWFAHCRYLVRFIFLFDCAIRHSLWVLGFGGVTGGGWSVVPMLVGCGSGSGDTTLQFCRGQSSFPKGFEWGDLKSDRDLNGGITSRNKVGGAGPYYMSQK